MPTLQAYRVLDGVNTPIGGALAWECGQLSKAGLINWAYGIQKLCCERKSVAGNSALTAPVLSTGNDKTPKSLFVPFFIVGRVPPAKGSKAASVSQVQNNWFPLYETSQVFDDGPHGPQNAGPVNVVWVNSRTGVTSPLWRSKVRAGSDATTGMTGIRYSLSAHPGKMSVSYQSPVHKRLQEVSTAGFFSGYAVPSKHSAGSLISSCDNGAYQKLHAKLYALEHDADIGETLGEYKQAMSMVGRPLEGMRKLLELYRKRCNEATLNVGRRYGRSMSRLDPMFVREVNAALGKLWLEFNFGWKPLWYELNDALKALEDIRNRDIKTKISASFRDNALVSDVTVRNVINSYCSMLVRTVKETRVSVRYQVGVNPKKVQALSFVERLGIVPSRFIPTLYAILPYSWLADYFLGINTVLDGLCDNFEFVTWVNKTVRQESIVETTDNPDLSDAKRILGDTFKGGGGSPSVVRVVRTDVVRSAPGGLAIPPLKFSVPKSWRPYANIASLLAAKKLPQASSLGSIINAASGGKLF